ncbi:hypothetical protein CEB3_c02640 [Peptococcaceae bacterium CEB3]|nr:hypothetical protein CEB3_c02640 [Peptococcaceae bacterium CEB3]
MSFNVSQFTRIHSGFEYLEIQDRFTEAEISSACNRLRQRYALHTKSWSNETNTEWVLRTYLAVKMVFSSSVMLTSLEYAMEKNLRIVEPYLLYYSILNTCRALILTAPDEKWDDGKLFSSSHNKIINLTVDYIVKINKDIGHEIKVLLERSKVYRELFSYKFPASGIRRLDATFVVEFEKAVSMARLFCELAQFNSEIFQASHNRNVDKKCDLDDRILPTGYEYHGEGRSFVDDEDFYRIGYIYRKRPYPTNLLWTMTEGMVEDFFGAWCSELEENNDDIYDPDKNWTIIFPVP